jgi:MFS family permease
MIRQRISPVTVLTAFAFFFSGAAALVYQVAWQRILAFHSGAGIYSVAMIVGAFMAGLGLGSALGGVLSTRVGPRRALGLFVLIELGIGAFGAASCALYYDWLYLRWWWLYESAVFAGLLHFLSLLFPTVLMGMSLPLLVRATVREAPRIGRTVGYLYAINVLGAAVGAVLTPWLLIRHLGIRGGVLAAALGNVVAAAVALLAGRRFGEAAPEGKGEREQGQVATLLGPEARPFGLWLLLYAASGFCALALEMLWFRVVDVVVKSTAFTFGTVLSVYLLGTGLGSLLAIRWAEKLRRPLRSFLLCQCLLLLYAGAAVGLLGAFLQDAPYYRELLLRFGEAGPYVPARHSDYVVLYAALPGLLFGPPTVLMGLSFPILQRGVHDDVRTSGRKVGFLQAANIAGCLLGSLLVGLVFLGALGTAGSLRVLLGLGLAFAGVGLRYYGGRSFAALAAALGTLLVLLPGQGTLWPGLHAQRAAGAVVEEDGTGVVLITPHPSGWLFWSQGKRNSRLPFGGIHTVLGAAPALVHPSPQDVAIIGLGSGDTAWAAGCRRATSRVTVFEIVGPQLQALRRLAEAQDIPELRSLLADERYDLRAADGRNAIDHGERLFDVIEMDALWPRSAFSGTLYSVDFFTRCARKLKPGGLMCSWAPTPRVRSSFRSAFPFVLDLAEGRVLLGSNDPIPLEVAVWQERLAAPEVQQYLGRKRGREVADYLESARPTSGPLPEPNRDLFPRDEFNTPE